MAKITIEELFYRLKSIKNQLQIVQKSPQVVKHVVKKSAPHLMWSGIKGADNFL